MNVGNGYIRSGAKNKITPESEMHICIPYILLPKKRGFIMLKKLLAGILALVCCLTLLAGCGDNGGGEETFGNVDSNLVDYQAPDLTGKTVNLYAFANSDWDPYKSWLMPKIEEALGFDLNYVELDSFSQQISTMIAERDVPDLTFSNTYSDQWESYGDDGAYINVYSYIDMMPNLKRFLEDPKHKNDVTRYTTREGALYAIPLYTPEASDPYVFLYRKDIFDANNLTFPTNQEEFVATLRKLKELYPKSYPFVIRSINGNMQGVQAFSHLWGGTHVLQGNYNTIFTLDENGEYYMAQISNAYKEMGMFLNELTSEGLMHPSCATMDTASWYESFSSNTSFITFDKTDRLPMMNRSGQALREEFQVVAAAPFNFGSYAKETDEVSTSFEPGIGSGSGFWYAIGYNENLQTTMAYVDWLYSDEGMLLTNWGIEGESFEVDENGERKYIQSFLDTYGGLIGSGLYQPGMVGERMEGAYRASLNEFDSASLELGLQFRGKHSPQHMIRYNDEEQIVYDTYALALFNYAQSQWQMMYMGRRDFSEWDQILEEMKTKYHYDELMEIHNSALKRLLEENGMS